jgi:outer membrane lipoprotein-sorting protein
LAWAEKKMTGEEIVKIMDEKLVGAKDQQFEFECTTHEPGKQPVYLKFDVAIKGEEWRRIKFTAPGDVKGMRVLVRSINQMYIYLPAYKRVRRIASHVRNQGFMGTALSHDDMAVVTYGKMMTSKLLSETDSHWKVESIKKPSSDFPYARMEFDIDKKLHLPSEIRYYNEKGVKLKTDIRQDYKCLENVCCPNILKFVDHTRNDMYSELTRKNWRINTGLKDSYFTVRSLQRGR